MENQLCRDHLTHGEVYSEAYLATLHVLLAPFENLIWKNIHMYLYSATRHLTCQFQHEWLHADVDHIIKKQQQQTYSIMNIMFEFDVTFAS